MERPATVTKSTPRVWRYGLIVAMTAVMILAFSPALAIAGGGHAASGLAPRNVVRLPTSVGAPTLATAAPLPNIVHAPLPTLPSTHLGHFVLPGPHPASWGPSGLPPGSEFLHAPPAMTHAHPSGYAGTPSSANWDNRFCAGLWPGTDSIWGSNPQGEYAAGCYGHDEPGIQFYSNLAGSGGNVTWNITLPNDRSATLNQSNLYSAMWFGMAMNDPYGWLNMCFLELQFYPDQTWYNPGPLYPSATVNGAWIGAAVAWQIEAATGAENPCFYEPLYLNGVPGPAYLNMTQGDRVTITMTGYASSLTGEVLTISDLTNGQASKVVMFNYAQNYPVNPSYSTNSYPAAFQWTPGGEYPVAFAFETGHAGNFNWPSNNSYGGCSGGPQSTPVDPAAPCPSYDPGSWANDSLTPWHIDMPTFFNAHATQSAEAQVAFTQPEGGMDLVDQTSNGVCSNVEGSGWCSYPWYSYYCSEHTFEFGATNYPGVTADFNKWNQINRVAQTNAEGIGFFPPTNFSVPTCGAPSYTLSVGSSGTPGGWAYFLHSAYTAATSVAGLGAGDYSLNAVAPAGAFFSKWVTTGGATVANTNAPWTSVTISGNGSVDAVFSTVAPAKTTITFDNDPFGFIGITPSILFANGGVPLGNFHSGSTFALVPGIYSIQGYPKPGYNFTDWSSSGGVVVAASHFPMTWITVTGATGTATLTAHYVASTLTATVGVYVIGTGSWLIAGHTIANVGPGYNFGSFTLPVGSYKTTITPGAGTVQTSILYGTSVVITDFQLMDHITFENGSDLLEVIFTVGTSVTFSDSPAAGGSIGFFGVSGLISSGTTLALGLGFYEITAAPATGYSFTGWASSNSANVQVFSPTSEVTVINVSGPATITASYSAAHHLDSVTFKSSPGAASAIQFNLGTPYAVTTVNPSVAPGEYLVTEFANPGWTFSSWSSTSKISFVSSPFGSSAIIDVTGSGTLTASFVRSVVLVTVVIDTPEGTTAAFETITIAGHVLHSGDTIALTTGAYWIQLASTDDGLYLWDVTPGLQVVSPHHTGSVIHLSGSGTLYAILVNTDAGSEGAH